MLKPQKQLLFIAVLLTLLSVQPALAEPDKTHKLSKKDKAMIAKLFEGLLIDATGAEPGVLKCQVRDVWGGIAEIWLEAWKRPATKNNRKAQYLSATGFRLPSPKKAEDWLAFDYLEESNLLIKTYGTNSTLRWLARLKYKNLKGNVPREIYHNDSLCRVAWLAKLGHESLAAEQLKWLHDGDSHSKLTQGLRGTYAWRHYSGCIHAFMVAQDKEALEHGQHFLKKFPEKKKDCPQIGHIVADLKRRQAEKTFGKTLTDAAPKHFAKLSTKQKLPFLLKQLDQVCARQWGQPGGVHLDSDWRVGNIIKLGEGAVPALIDCLENDARLTRSVHFWRDFSYDRTVLTVKECALTAISSILRTEFFEVLATGDNFSGRDEKRQKSTVQNIRTYWKRWGHLSFDARMMAILTNPKHSIKARKEAAKNLASFGSDEVIGTTVWTGDLGESKHKVNPLIKRYSKPTVAEAIVQFLDQGLAKLKATKIDKEDLEYEHETLLAHRLACLERLGDKAITGALLKRFKAQESFEPRLLLAGTCQVLGEPRPVDAIAMQLSNTPPPIKTTNTNVSRALSNSSKINRAKPAAEH